MLLFFVFVSSYYVLLKDVYFVGVDCCRMSGVDFESFLNGSAIPPIVPIVSGPGDTRHFEENLEDQDYDFDDKGDRLGGGEGEGGENSVFVALGEGVHTRMIDPFKQLFR
jgi:hypothetical protein